MRKIAIAAAFSICTIVSIAQEDTIRVMYYNLLNYPNIAQERADTLKKIIDHTQPDMFVVNELTSSFGATLIMSNALNVGGTTSYAQANFVNGPDTDNMFFYNSDKIGLKEQNEIATALRDINEYICYYKSADIATTTDTIFFYVYSVHLKASSGSSNENQRYQEAVVLKNYIDNQPNAENVLIGGDFNIYGASEPAFDEIVNGGNMAMHDPINMVGEWNTNFGYRFVHTQSTRTTAFNGGSTGGMDDRFDFIFINDEVQDGSARAEYIDGSYRAVGQDGNHFNFAMNAGSNTSEPADVINALYEMSDHLPVYMEIAVGGTVGVQEQNNLLSNYNLQNGVLNIWLHEVQKELEINVFDLSGKLISRTTRRNVEFLTHPLSGLSQGLYVVQLKSGFNTTSFRLFQP